jgi:hypothetical protein
MIRRALLVAAAAVALIFAPTTAMAAPGPNYTAPGYTVTVSDSTPRVGHPVKFNVTGGTAKGRLTLTITQAGSDRNHGIDFTKLNAKGAGSFEVKFNKAGTYTVTIKDSKGHVISTQVIKVSKEEAAGRGAAEGSAASGLNMGLAVGGGLLVLLLAGAGGVLYTRHRKSVQLPA